MIPKTETAFTLEGITDRVKILYSNYLSIRRKADMDQAVDLAIDLGEGLLELKGKTTTQNFFKTIAFLNIPTSTATYYMNLFKKFGNYRELAKDLGVSKCRVLDTLNKEEIRSLIEGNALYGLFLGDILKMPYRHFSKTFASLRKADSSDSLKKRMSFFGLYLKLAFSALARGIK